MAKIPFDKYYTPPTVAKWCIEKTKEIIGEQNITEWLEPSAGAGSFSHQLKGCKAYDLYPQHEYIEQCDYLEVQLDHKPGRCTIGNPPFGGSSGRLIKEFYERSAKHSDYIAFILPASYYNDYKRLYKFEIVYSCIIETPYTNEKLKTSFTIYKRNPQKDDWRDTIKEEKLSDITFQKYTRSNKKDAKHKSVLPYDLCYNGWGDILKPTRPYKHVQTFTLKINRPELREKIVKFFDWAYKWNKETGILELTSISSANINISDIIKLMRICIPEIK